MRDKFYQWLTLVMGFAIQFGAAIQRAVDGHIIWSELIGFGVAMGLAALGLADRDRSGEKYASDQ